MIKKEPVNKETAAIVVEQTAQLRDLFPQALTLGKTDLLIYRDKAMTDELAANLALQCGLKTI